MGTSTNIQYLHASLGGANGGKYIATGTANAAVDFLFVAADTVFTVLTDNDDTNILTVKALAAITVPAGVILSAGTHHKIKAVSYSSGTVFGYTIDTGSF
jgi:hypothetical protein